MANKRETAMDFLGGLGDAVEAPPLYLPVTSLQPDLDQPRKTFGEEELQRLAAAIKSDGILQPLLVRETGSNPPYKITDGERRWRAAQLVKLDQVPCFIRNDIDAKRLKFIQAMANANREDLSDYELAVVIQEQLDGNPKLKKKDVAEQLGKDPSAISRLLALLEPAFSDLAKIGLIEGAATLSHFKALDDESKAQLLEAAQQGQAITRDAIEARKAAIAADKAATAAPATPETTSSAAPDGTSQDLVGQDLHGHAGTNVDVDGGQVNTSVDGSDDEHEHDSPPGGDDGAGTSVATARDKPAGASKAPPLNPGVKIALKVEDVELLIPFFVDKEAEKLDLKMTRDTAMGLIEKLGISVPGELADYPQAIKDGIAKQLGQ